MDRPTCAMLAIVPGIRLWWPSSEHEDVVEAFIPNGVRAKGPSVFLVAAAVEGEEAA